MFLLNKCELVYSQKFQVHILLRDNLGKENEVTVNQLNICLSMK